MKVATTSRPGVEKGFGEEETANTIAMQRPAPTTDAAEEAAIMSFSRIGIVPW